MKNARPIAILLATYNGEIFISQQIDSIINQTNKEWILYLSDDCSTDETPEILEDYCRQHPNKIKNLNNKRRFGNAKDHFFSMIKTVESDYYMFSDQDDVWDKGKIDKSYLRMLRIESENHETPILVHTDLKVTDERLVVISDSFAKYSGIDPQRNTLRVQLIQNCITGCTALFNASLRDLLLRYTSLEKDTASILMHDWWLALIAIVFGRIDYVAEPTVMYRQHSSNSLGATNTRNARHIISRLRKHDIRHRIVATMKQAEQFCWLYKELLDPGLFHLIDAYANVCNKNKVKRISFYLKTRILKQGAVRKIAQIIWG